MRNIQDAPLFKCVFDLLKQYHVMRRRMPKVEKYTLGGRIEDELIGLLADIMEAGRVAKSSKSPIIHRAMRRNDALKIFIRLGHEINLIEEKTYIDTQTKLQRIGRMLGGWSKSSSN